LTGDGHDGTRIQLRRVQLWLFENRSDRRTEGTRELKILLLINMNGLDRVGRLCLLVDRPRRWLNR
jgi:hypothetical protein